MIVTNLIIQSQQSPRPPNTWLERSSFANWIARRRTIVYRWQTSIQLRKPILCLRTAGTGTQPIFLGIQQHSSRIEYVDALVKAGKCAQYVDDIDIAAHNVEELLSNIEAVFQQIQKAGLNLSMSKCAFGHPQINFLGTSITSKGVAPIEDKIDKFLKTMKTPTSVKSLQRYIGFVQFYRQYIPRLAEKLTPLYKLLQKDIKFQLT